MSHDPPRVARPGWPVERVLEWIDDACFLFDQGLDCVYANTPAGVLFGVATGSLIGRNLRSDFAAALAVDFQRAALPIIASGTPGRATWGDDASRRWFEATVYPSADGVLAIIADVTARKGTELERVAQLEYYQQLLDQVPAFLWVIDRDLIVRRIEGGAPMLAALDRDRLIGLPMAEVTRLGASPADLDVSMDMHRRVLQGEPGHYRATWKGITLESLVRPLRDRDGTIVGILGIGVDVTERMRMEAQLRSSEERFRAVVERTTDLIAILDESCRVAYASPSHARVLGYSPSEVRSIDPWSLIHSEDIDDVRAEFATLDRHRQVRLSRPIRIRAKHDGWRHILIVLTDLRRDQAVGGVVVNARDVTKEFELESQLRQSQKLEALGQLAGGVAHDFNNVLAAMSGYAQLVHEDLAEDDPRRRDLEEILKAGERAANITRQLLAFSKPQVPTPVRLDLVEVVHELSGMLRALLPATIALRLSPDRDSPPVEVVADRNQIELVITNLVVNARDAMPTGGTLSVDVRPETASTTEPTAVLEVRDGGTGMTPEVQRRVFEPFFTTKEPGRGTGLGLATVHGIVQRHSGSIGIASTLGEGTTVTVRLPLAVAGVQPAVHPIETVEHDHTGRVLIVEDEAQVRKVTARLLEGAGYEVVTAPDAAAAIDLLISGARFDVVLTDSAMPGMRGEDLAEVVVRLQPGLPVILMSGYRDPAWGQTPSAVAAFVQKPFTVPGLLAEVRRAVARGRPSSG
jgi:PAS domain S-box-containing protein